MNQFILVGRLTKDPEIIEVNGKKKSHITVAVQRQHKNEDGIYESDFIPIILWNSIAEKVSEYCKKGDVVSVKARIQNNNYTDKNGEKKFEFEFIGDQVSFVTSQKIAPVEERE